MTDDILTSSSDERGILTETCMAVDQDSEILSLRPERLLDYVILFLPKLLIGFIVVFIGYLLGMFIGGLVRVRASRFEGISASYVGNATKYSIWGIAIIMALEKIGFLSSFVISILVVIFGAVALTLAIAFGLAFKDNAKDLLARWLGPLTKEKKPEAPKKRRVTF